MNKVYLFLLSLLVILGFSFFENVYAGCQWYTAGPFSSGCVTGASYDYIFDESWMDHAYNNGEGPCQNPPNSCSKNDALCAPYGNAYYSSTSYYCPGSSCSQACLPNTPAGCATSCATCTYIDEVLSWTECVDSVQVADEVHQTIIPGTICSDVPLLRSCTVCGNGVKETGEQCDLGNVNHGDGNGACPKSCSTTCTDNCCTAIDGVCNPATGTSAAPHPATCLAPVNSPLNTNLCSIGTASAVTGTGPWTWTCNGPCGGAAVNCRADQASVSCGSATAAKYCKKPDTNLCSNGATASAVSGTGPWTWNCSCGSSDANCQAEKQEEESFTITGENCSVSCGGGSKKIGGVKKCVGEDLIITNTTEACNSQPCPPGYREVTPW
ncbi:MAG: hypothetical protein V1690_02945 [Candidatus Moraniibacteriota bacterium]